MLGRLGGGDFTYDPYGHGSARTMHVAHLYIEEHWDKLENNEVICVESILGEREEAKKSEKEVWE